jgi:hypothetical protein
MKLGSWLLLVFVLSVTSSGVAGDWPQFKRDAARTGDSPDEALAFPLERITAVRFPAPIYASPQTRRHAKEPRTKRLVPQHQPRSKWNGLGGSDNV